MKMLVTRPEPDAFLTRARLAALNIRAEVAPVMVRQTLETSLPRPDGFTALVLTSANSVRALLDRHAVAPYRHLPVFAVGDHTAREAIEAGFIDVRSAAGAFQDLVNAMVISKISGPILYPAGRHQSADLAYALAPLGVMVVTPVIYEMIAIEALPDAILAGLRNEIDAVLLYSRRSAEIFTRLAEELSIRRRRELAMLCMSEGMAQPLLDAHFSRISLADRPDEDAMMMLALAFVREQTGA